MKIHIGHYIIYSMMKLFIILFFLGCTKGQSVNYYVSNHGNDDNDGLTIDNAIFTIQEAANRVKAGDSVFVIQGQYEECVHILYSGELNKEIVFTSKPLKSAYINGGFEIRGSYIKINGFNITNKLQKWPDRIAIHIEGNNIEISDNYIFEVQNEAIRGSLKRMPTDIVIKNNKIYHSQMGIVVEGNNWIVRNNEIKRLFNYGNGDCDYSRFFGDNHKFISNLFHGTFQFEVGGAHVDCFQTFDNNGQYAHNIIIEKNRCKDFMQGFMGEAHYHHDISNIIFRNNIFENGFLHNSHGMIVQDIPKIQVFNNNFINIKWRGIAIQASDNRLSKYAVIKNNIFYNCGTSYSYFDNTSIGDFNLIFNTKSNPNAGENDIINQDPMFNEMHSGDYRLKSNSPAIDTGDIIDYVSDDILGTYRPIGASHDIGAYEYLDKKSAQKRQELK
jgi:hypothetical protein